MFCDELEVIVPLRALSAGTLIAIGANRIIMTKQGIIGPIDPSVNNPLNPIAKFEGVEYQVPVSVENVRGYLDVARKELQLKGEKALSSILKDLTSHIHPLVLGEIFRTQTQIRFLAEKLLQHQVDDRERIKSIIDFLCGDSGSHDYTINRREAVELGLNVEKPSESFYSLLRQIYVNYSDDLLFSRPFNHSELIQNANLDTPVTYSLLRGLIESTSNESYQFVTEGVANLMQNSNGDIEIDDQINFQGWKQT